MAGGCSKHVLEASALIYYNTAPQCSAVITSDTFHHPSFVISGQWTVLYTVHMLPASQLNPPFQLWMKLAIESHPVSILLCPYVSIDNWSKELFYGGFVCVPLGINYQRTGGQSYSFDSSCTATYIMCRVSRHRKPNLEPFAS